jgi:hypothetical protein
MAALTAETPLAHATPPLGARVADAARRVVHLADDARVLTSAAGDAVEDSVRRARRAMNAVKRDAFDARDEAIYRIKREPLKAVGFAFGVGLCVGVASGLVTWLATRGTHRTET